VPERKIWVIDGTWMIVEPFAQDRLEDNLNPVGRIFYPASTTICLPVSRSQEVDAGLGRRDTFQSRLRSAALTDSTCGRWFTQILVMKPAEAGRNDQTWKEGERVRRTPVNPTEWSLRFGFNQAEIIEGYKRELVCAGQVAVDAEGNPQHPGDMAAQIRLALDNLQAVLEGAGMNFSNVVRLNMYTTDVDSFLQNAAVLAERLGAMGISPPGTLLGVSRLAFGELMVELEATAID
jgi:enamine deaminase RidA (YjgF/YER057c/UK114 family)